MGSCRGSRRWNKKNEKKVTPCFLLSLWGRGEGKEERRLLCLEGMEPDLQRGAGREGEEAWAGEAVRVLAEGLEGRAGAELARDLQRSAFARNAE